MCCLSRSSSNEALPAPKKVLEKTQSTRGANSPRTLISVFEISERFGTPADAERRLRHVKWRADKILSAYEGGIKVSWAGVLAGLMACGNRVGKAAVYAVAYTLGYRPPVGGRWAWHQRKAKPNYRSARDWLIDLHLCQLEDTSDGVLCKRTEKPALSKFWMEVFRTAIPKVNRAGHKTGTHLQWLVRSTDGRTYHNEWANTPTQALREALSAWKRQDKLAAMDADLVGFLKGDCGFCPLVVREDSQEAGNCLYGTESWLRQRGWDGRKFIPAVWLTPHLNYSLVRNVVMKLYDDWQRSA